MSLLFFLIMCCLEAGFIQAKTDSARLQMWLDRYGVNVSPFSLRQNLALPERTLLLAVRHPASVYAIFCDLWSDLAWDRSATGHRMEPGRAAYYAHLIEDPSLGRVYDRVDNPSKASKTFNSPNVRLQKRAVEVADHLHLEKKRAELLLPTKSAPLSRLKAETQTQQATYLKRQRWMLASIAVLTVVTSTLIIYYLWRSSKLRRALKLRNEEIEKQAKALAEANQLKDRLFSILSHDLRGPVASIKAALVLQQNKALSDAEISGIDQQVNRLQELIDNLLYWSMNQQNGLRVYPRPVYLHDLLNEVIEAYKGLIGTKQIEVILEGPDICFQTDDTLAVLVIRNIFHNALKFTPLHGQVLLKTEHAAGEVKLHIRDTGVGMNASLLPGLSQQGTGLGLPLSDDLMKLCGGSLSIKSTIGAGTTVTLTWLTQSATKPGDTAGFSNNNSIKY